MIRRSLAGLAVVALAAGSAVAHEGHSHATKMMGTVKAVHADMNHVELATRDGVKGFYVNASTRFVRGGAKLTLADLKPGTRVVVQAQKEGDKMLAVEVKIAGRPAAAPTTPK